MAKYQENIGENHKGELQILESKFEGSAFPAKIPREVLRIWDPKLGIRGFQKRIFDDQYSLSDRPKWPEIKKNRKMLREIFRLENPN